MMHSKPIALDAYEKLAERFATQAETKAENAFIERPAMLEAIGDVRDLTILDAGCGPGFLLKKFVEGGARAVTGFDVSPKMVELASARTQGKVDLFIADLAEPLMILPSAHFDLVTSSLALDYVRDWKVALGEFRRLVKPGGRLIFSVMHPIGSYNYYNPPSVYGVHQVESAWRGFGGEPVVVPDHYRSFSEIVNPVLQAGFQVHSVTDTKPIEALRAREPAEFEKYNKRASFMIVSARVP
jgi:SAM-dependent methyltransferase